MAYLLEIYLMINCLQRLIEVI